MFKREPLHEPLSDNLRQLRERGDGFRLPDNYLEELKQRIPAAEANPTPIVRRLFPRYRKVLAIAATVALLLTIGWAWLDTPATQPTGITEPLAEANLDALSDEEILAYVEENISEFELSLLYTDPETTPAAAENLTDEELDELYYELLDEE